MPEQKVEFDIYAQKWLVTMYGYNLEVFVK